MTLTAPFKINGKVTDAFLAIAPFSNYQLLHKFIYEDNR
jgi:hypothetical protein